ncbi:hypothetical protein GALL_489980 [mine drainage metagenome]|uniref:Uncharacterized protein n=1 Tax=mine drainage metagenome TaxID=410659 RepID=A0A1J5PDV5_9ZZZZ
MGFFALVNHAVNFLAPAVWLALWLPLVSCFLMKKKLVARTLYAQAVIQLIVGCLVLGAGLVVFGHDGKMATYLALVVLGASSQWLMSRR